MMRMPDQRQKWIARLLLVAIAVVGLGWLARLDYAEKVSTNVLDLIPSDERQPELALARDLVGDEQARVVLFALDMPAGAAGRGAAEAGFVEALRSSGLIAEVVSMGDTSLRDALGRTLFENRFDLLLPGWMEARWAEYQAAGVQTPWPEWLARRSAERLQAFLTKPEALAFQDLLPADPLLLLPELVESVQSLQTSAIAGEGSAVLIWARTSVSPWRDEGQGPVFDAVHRATAAARETVPGSQIRWMSIGRFAHQSRERIQQELSTLNILSLVAVLGIAGLCLRGVLRAFHLAPVLLGALLGAWVATTVVFDHVHVLVFVVGSLLGGVAIDYGFYLYLQPAAYPGEPYDSRVRRLIKPLLASALTTVVGFSLLLLSELPLIRQLGVFVSAGLLSALATALLWFAQIRNPLMGTRSFARARYHGESRSVRFIARGLLVAGVLVGVVGPWLLTWRDDIRDLEIPAPVLTKEAGEVRGLFGDSDDRAAYITRGSSLADGRAMLARFHEWHARQNPGATVASVANALPTPHAWESLPERLATLDDFAERLKKALGEQGFETEPFERFAKAWSDWRATPRLSYEDACSRLISALRGPLGMMVSVRPGHCWMISVASAAATSEPPAELATVSVSALENMNQLFSRYRTSALRLSAAGFGVVGLSMLVLYGGVRGATIFAIPAGCCLFAFGLLGLLGQTLGLFHLLGAFLGVCLSHNYAIFTAENAARGEESPPSIRLSALTTAASFGILGISKIPVVQALGITVALIVISALVVVELLPLARPRAVRVSGERAEEA